VVAGLGVLLFFVLRDGAHPTPAADAGASSALPSLPADATVPGGASPTGTLHPDASSAGQGHISGSDRVALQWMQAMYEHDFRTAYRLSCSSMQGLADQIGRQRGSSGPDVLGAAFFEDAVDGQTIEGGRLTGVDYDSSKGDDVASFTLELGDGSTTTVELLVDGKVTVCDWR
jgi:hypothetical protein